MDKDVSDLDIELIDALDHSEWRRMIGGNLSDRSSDSDVESCIQSVRFWRWLTHINLAVKQVCCCVCLSFTGEFQLSLA